MNQHRVSIVLPTYNEKDNIGRLIKQLDSVLQMPAEFLVVDDNSPDGTAAIVEDLSRELAGVTLILRKDEKGLTSAIQRGIDESKGDVVVWMDCDLSMPAETVPMLINEIIENNNDVAIGSRYVRDGSTEYELANGVLVYLQKRLTRGLNWFAQTVSRTGFTDWTSGFIAIRGDVIRELRLRGDYGEYFIYLLKEIAAQGCKVVELPYHNRPREYGESKTARNFFDLVAKGRKYIVALFS